jgi:transcriptional regulator of acetoin/glycerol metabolism
MLVDSFLQRGSGKHRLPVEPAAMARLQAHDWPGNIRELRNALERARLFADDGIVRAEYLPESLGAGARTVSLEARPPTVTPVPLGPQRREIDDAALRALVANSHCTRKELARLAGLSERTLYRRLKSLGLA